MEMEWTRVGAKALGIASLLLFAMLAGCQPNATGISPNPSANGALDRADTVPPPSAAVVPAEPTTPPTLGTEGHLPGYTILMSAPWPDAAGFSDVTAAIAQPPGIQDVRQRVL